MNVKLKALSAGVLFFIGHSAFAQNSVSDTVKTKEIEEVVMVGVQSKKRAEITQAVSIVTGEELTRMSQSSTSVTNMLQGKMSGVQVSGTSGKPGDTGAVRIRGAVNVSGAQGATDPLFVVDGIYMTQRQFNVIPASDIESATVLKDAASAAQYGSRASNGVIIVTTKRGKSGKPVISYDTRMGFATKPDDINFTMMNTSQKIKYENDLFNLGIHARGLIGGDLAASYLANSHKWSESILKNSSIQYHNVSLRGGGDKNSYFASLGYDSDTGIIQDFEGFKRYNARFNFDQKVSDKMKMGFDFAVINTETDDQRYSYNALSPFYSLYTLNDYEPVRQPNGAFNPTSNGINPIDQRLNERSSDRRTRLSGQIFGEYNILEGLDFRTSFGTIYDNRYNKNVVRKGSDIAAVYGLPDGQIRDTRSEAFNYVFNNRLNYTKDFGNHKIGALAMIEFTKDDFASLAGTKRVMIDANTTDVGSAATPAAITGATTSTRMISYLGVLDYNYAGRYLLSGSVRRDGSSRLGVENQFGDFWSASAAWNVAKESFFNVPFFNDIKFRYSVGTTGNIAGLLDYQNVISAVAGDYGNSGTVGPRNFVGNPDIKWENKKSQNLGIDLAMYKNRFKLTAEVFKDDRKDFIFAVPNLPFESGGYLYNTVTNAGNIVIKGFESELNAEILRTKDFSWSIRGNVSVLDYKVNSLNGTQQELQNDSFVVTRVGDEPNVFKLVKSAGVDPNNGDALFYKLDGSITNVYSAGDAQVLTGKSTLPSTYGGFGTSFNYKGFDLNADFSFQTGAYTYNQTYANLVDFSGSESNMSTDAANFWTKPGDVTFLPKPSTAGIRTSDAFLQKTDNIRFRNLEVGYTFDKNFLGENIPVNNIRIYGSGQNLALWTDFNGDPDVSLAVEGQANSNAYVPNAYTLYNYPNVRTFIIGMQINF